MEETKSTELLTELEKARAQFAAARGAVDSQQELVRQGRADLEAKRSLLGRLQEQYDQHCLDGATAAAREVKEEITTTEIEVHGAELRALASEQALVPLEQARRETAEVLDRLERAEALRQEAARTDEMIQAAEAAYQATDRACGVLLESLGALNKYGYIDEANQKRARQAGFRISARCKGFNFD